MLESPAWAAMTLAARKVVERVAIEHLKHGGRENGELIVTHVDFGDFGIRRSTIIEAIRIADDLGFIDVTVKGLKSYGTRRLPSQYGLTWLGRRDRTPPSNRWARIDQASASRIVAAARDPSWRPKRPASSPSRDIDSSLVIETGEHPQLSAIPSLRNVTGLVPKVRLGNARK
jgi:hypothetical protein